MNVMQRLTIGLAAVALTTGGVVVAEDGGPMQGPKVQAGERGEGARQRGDGQRQRAEGERGERGRGQLADRMHRLMEGVNLTEDQKAQVRPIMEEAAEKWRAFHEEHKEELDKLREEMKAAREAKDKDKAKEVGQKVRAIMEQADFRGDAIEKIKKVLTPEQLATFEKNLEEMKDRGPGERGPRLSPEEREKLKDMTPEQRREYMRGHHPRQGGEGQQQRRGPEGDGGPKKLDI